MALQNSIAIAPVLTLGEGKLYKIISNSWIRKFQRWALHNFSFVPCLFYGRFLTIPYREPLLTIIAKPIIPKDPITHPTDQDIRDLQEKYIESLRDIHARYSDSKYYKCKQTLRIE
jgi:hypothetical protein